MNNEIKEILDRIETASEIFDCLLKPKECTALLDYITNLLQENKRLKENNSNMQEEMARTWQKCDDYKSRCEKAIKLYQNCKEEDWCTLPIDMVNILQNGSEKKNTNN